MSDNQKKDKIDLSKHWFWGVIIKNKSVYVQVILATIFINIFGFVSAFYIMTVYDRVLPNYAMNSLIALTIGMAIVIIFDFILKMLRSYISDIANKDLDQNIRVFDGDRIFIEKSEFNIPEQIIKAKGTNISPDNTVVFVSGEVKNPGQTIIPQGASLNQAIALAGGKEYLSGKVEFLRFNSDGSMEKRKFRFKQKAKINSHSNPSLKTGDIINIHDSALGNLSNAVTELTRPFIGIYSFYNLVEN